MSIVKQYVMSLIAVLLLVGLSFGLIVSFNLIEQDRVMLDKRLNELDAKYNTMQKELTEAINKQDKVLMLMAVYRDGINTLKMQMDDNNIELAESINEVAGNQEMMAEELSELSATGGYGVLTGNEVLPMPANLDEPMDEPFVEDDFTMFKEEQFEEGTLVEEVERNEEGLEILTPLLELEDPAPIFTCPERDKSVDLDRYIRRIEFSKTTTVVLNYDVVDGNITNIHFTDINGNAGRRLFEALEKYLLASAIVIDPEGRNCRLPFRINVE